VECSELTRDCRGRDRMVVSVIKIVKSTTIQSRPRQSLVNSEHSTSFCNKDCKANYHTITQKLVECSELTRDRRGRDRMVVGFTIFITETRGVL
jgi:hypothetical protein